jgi:tRNA threonylcarbamoyladenosine biosynthesis protein TsaE
MRLVVALEDCAATDALGTLLARTLPATGPQVVYLEGELGAGKTSLARALLRGLGVAGPVRSPTYTLLERYPLAGGGEAAHLDLYRIVDAGELDFLGLDDLASARLWLVEWPQRGRGGLPAASLHIDLQTVGGGRRAGLLAADPAGAAWLARLQAAAGTTGLVVETAPEPSPRT